MRVLGFLFVVLLVVGIVGWWRGWFAVDTARAGERSQVQFQVDEGKIDDDARRVTQGIGELSRDTVDKVKSLARGESKDERIVEGSVVAVDAADRDLTVTSGDQRIDMTVPSSVPIRRDGRDVPLREVVAGHRVSLTFHVNGETWSLQRIELLS